MRRLVRYRMETLILLLAAAFAAGCGGDGPMSPVGPRGFGGQGMTGGGMGMQAGGEFQYLTGMIPHHEEAIVAAGQLARGTDRQQMRRFANSIIETQTAEVNQMKRWLAAWYPGRDTRVSYDPMMRDLAQLRGDAIDRAFLEDMIPHHHMAVMMSQQVLMRGALDHGDVVPFAQNIRDVQQAEIQMMVTWLRDWFGVGPGMGH